MIESLGKFFQGNRFTTEFRFESTIFKDYIIFLVFNKTNKEEKKTSRNDGGKFLAEETEKHDIIEVPFSKTAKAFRPINSELLKIQKTLNNY